MILLDLKKSIVHFFEQLQKYYFIDKNFEALIPLLDDEITVINSNNTKIPIGYDEIKKILFKKKKQQISSFSFTNHHSQTILLSETICMLFGESYITKNNGKGFFQTYKLYFTIVCKAYNDTIKLLHLHFSTLNKVQNRVSFFSPIYTKNIFLKNQFYKNISKLNKIKPECEILLSNIPISILRYLPQKDITFLFISDGFLKLTGYTREEIKILFHHNPIEMIVEEDRNYVNSILEECLYSNACFALEFKIYHKSGKILWVFQHGKFIKDSEGTHCIYCILIDITSTKTAQEELRLSQQRYGIIMDQSTEIIFEWNIKKDSLFFSNNWEKKFGYKALTDNVKNRLYHSSNIHPDDISLIKSMADKNFMKSRPYSEMELRLKNAAGHYLWCRLKATILFDRDGNPDKAVGVIIDIDKQKKETLKLMEQAQKDSLTGLYNKVTAQTLIEKTLKSSSPNDSHALIIIDIDNFKSVNDSLGHLFGDVVLTDISTSIIKLMGSHDIAGRIGGDEFIVLIKNIDEKTIKQKAAEISNIYHRTYRGVTKDYAITGSIGISVYPKDGLDFQTLFQNADTALYLAKNQGKNCYQIFDATMKKAHYRKLWKPEKTIITDTPSQENFIAYLFNILYEEKDIFSGIHMILGLIGKQYNVGRVYIYETIDDNGTYLSNTFEWCNKGIQPHIGSLQNIPCFIEYDYKKNFKNNSVFYCNNMKTLSTYEQIMMKENVLSLLQCPILEEGKFRGFIGYDEYNLHRIWTKDEIHTLSVIAKLLSIFLIKMRKEQSIDYPKITSATCIPSDISLTEQFQSNAYQLITSHPSQTYAMLYCNIDKFKYINDILGYKEGDFVLNYFARCIQFHLKKGELVSHIAMDRFVILIKYHGESNLNERLEQLKKLLEYLPSRKTSHYRLKVLWGVYIIKDIKENILSIIDKAALAAKEAKNIYGRPYCLYSEQMDFTLVNEKQMENTMELALQNNDFILCIQPQIDLSTKKPVAAEVLVRWKQYSNQYNYPDNFIPLFEKNGFVLDLDYYVFEETCKLLRKWIDQNKMIVPLAVNFSALHMKEPDFVSMVEKITNQYQIPAQYLDLELTEQSFSGDMAHTAQVIQELKNLGFQIALDDFGSGYSSFQSLKTLPVDIIKLDKSFFSGCHPTEKDKILISGMTDMAHKLGLKVIAEGVETQTQFTYLEQLHCDYVQGFLTARPLSIEDFENYLQKFQK